MKKLFYPRIVIFSVLSVIALLALANHNKVLQIFKNGIIIDEYEVSEIDYIEVNDKIPTPTNVIANVLDNAITIRWNEVTNASYDIYRSSDNVNFTLLASGIAQTSYTDSHPVCGTNYYKVRAVIDGMESGYSDSAVGTISGSDMESGVYLGINAFNYQLYPYAIQKISDNTVDGYYAFINSLSPKNGTILCYAVDKAITTLQSVELPSNTTSAYVVTFTDGLDQGSVMMDVPFTDENAYLDALKSRIDSETASGLPIKAFSVGIRGNDVQNSAEIQLFSSSLKKLASYPSDEYSYEVTEMNQVKEKFVDIAEKISTSNYIQTINLRMPGTSDGSLIRFTFDNVGNAANSKVYIEGTFNLSARSLENVRYVGLTSTSGDEIKGIQDGIFVTFTFENVHTSTNTLIDQDKIYEWRSLGSDTWQRNSEFDPSENANIVTTRNSAVIMFVLDCSSSLANDFYRVQSYAKEFVRILKEHSVNTTEVESVSLDRTDMVLSVGETYTLQASVYPATALLQTVEWSSSNPLVAAVDSKGCVTAKASGNAVITARTVDGGHTASCDVTVAN